MNKLTNWMIYKEWVEEEDVTIVPHIIIMILVVLVFMIYKIFNH